jgi:hypothetical protein
MGPKSLDDDDVGGDDALWTTRQRTRLILHFVNGESKVQEGN